MKQNLKIKSGKYKGYSVVFIGKGQISMQDGWFLEKKKGNKVIDSISIEDALDRTNDSVFKNYCVCPKCLYEYQSFEDTGSHTMVSSKNEILYQFSCKMCGTVLEKEVEVLKIK